MFILALPHVPLWRMPSHTERLRPNLARVCQSRVQTERSRMEHIPTAISVAALIVAFIAVVLNKLSSELPKEKKPRKKRQPKEVPQQA